MREHLSSLEIYVLENILLSPADNNKINFVTEKMETVNFITVLIYSSTLSVSNTGVNLDTASTKFPELEKWLRSSASMVLRAEFESAICKLLDKKPINPTDVKRESVCNPLMHTRCDDILKVPEMLLTNIVEEKLVAKSKCASFFSQWSNGRACIHFLKAMSISS